MADNLSVSVTADTSELRAQLALAQADLRAFGAETKKLANDIRAGGDAGGVLRGQLEQVAGQFNSAKSEVTRRTAALREHKATGIDAVIEGLKGTAAPLTATIGGLREFAEFARSMAELGERD